MFRTAVRRLTPSFIIPIFEHKNEYDHDYVHNTKPKEPETGWERVKKIYTSNEYDEHSVELHVIGQSAMGGAFIGACMGGFFKSREAYLYFIENNQATIFKSTAQAKKQLQDFVTVAFAKGAYTWGWRLALFTGLFSTVATTIQVYRGDTSIVEYITAGAISGAIYRANLGLAASMVGAALGASLSTVCGGAILLILKVTGVSLDDIWKALYKLKEAREDQYRQAEAKASEEKNDPLIKHHDLMVSNVVGQKIEDV